MGRVKKSTIAARANLKRAREVYMGSLGSSKKENVPLSTPKDTCTPPSSPKKKKARKSDEILPGQAGVPAGEGLEDERPVTLRHDFGDSANPTTESDSEAGKETVDDTTSDRDSNKTGEGKEAE